MRVGRIVGTGDVESELGEGSTFSFTLPCKHREIVFDGCDQRIAALTDALRPEVEPFGIDVVNVLPGPIATHFQATLLKDIPDTGPQSPYAYFKTRLAQRMRAFLDPKGIDVLSAETVAQVVLKAAKAKRPSTRYNVGMVAKLGYIGRALTPDRVVDFMTRRNVPVIKK